MRRAFAVSWVLVLLACRPCVAASEDDRPYMSALRSLSVNRSLLAKVQTEYRLLLQEEPFEPDNEATAKRLSDLRYKIQAFQEDAERLRGALPADRKADDFLQEMDIAAEKKIEEKARAIYALHERALGHVAAGRFEEAQKDYEEIILLSPDDDEAYLLLGHSGLAAGDYEKASGAFRNAMHIDPANAREIPRLYENILVENPSDDEAMTLLGYAYLVLGDSPQARLAFEEALRINSSNEAAKRGLLEIP